MSVPTTPKQILFINACVRPQSRTYRLAQYALRNMTGTLTEVNLAQLPVAPLSTRTLAERERFIAAQDFAHPCFEPAKQFARADQIVLAAPYWDLSFPALLKAYLEAITVVGITFTYGPDGRPHGLCRAKQLLYITTAGGPVLQPDFGYGYVAQLCRVFYGITRTHCICAQGLDIVGADVPALLQQAQQEIDALALT